MTYWMISKEQKKNKNSKPMPFWMGSPITFWNYSRFGKWWESCVFFILLSAKLVTWVNFDSQDSWSGRSKKRKFKFLTYGMGENRKKNARFSLPWLSKSTVNPNTQQLKAWMMIRVSVSQSATSHPVTFQFILLRFLLDFSIESHSSWNDYYLALYTSCDASKPRGWHGRIPTPSSRLVLGLNGGRIIIWYGGV